MKSAATIVLLVSIFALESSAMSKTRTHECRQLVTNVVAEFEKVLKTEIENKGSRPLSKRGDVIKIYHDVRLAILNSACETANLKGITTVADLITKYSNGKENIQMLRDSLKKIESEPITQYRDLD